MPSSGERSIARLCCQNITRNALFNHPVSEEPALTQPQKMGEASYDSDTRTRYSAAKEKHGVRAFLSECGAEE